jgi:hypothetical protein
MSEDQRAVLLEWLGKTKTAARRVVSEYLKTIPENTRLVSDTKLQALSQFHPNKRFPSNVVFVLRRSEPYFTLALHVEAKSGGFVDFSWIKCVENLYGGYNKERARKANTLNALRNEAFKSTAMKEARADLGDVCNRCKNRCQKLVVDHAGKPFAQIVDEFLQANRITLDNLKICGRGPGSFRLLRLSKAWRKFHDQHATLEGLCNKCNCSLGSRGYRHTKAQDGSTANGAVSDEC